MNDADVMERLVSITTLNKGGAAKVFERAETDGAVFVLKNNTPMGVIVSPEEYSRLVGAEENHQLLLEALSRLQESDAQETYTQEEVLAQFGIGQADLDAAEDPDII